MKSADAAIQMHSARRWPRIGASTAFVALACSSQSRPDPDRRSDRDATLRGPPLAASPAPVTAAGRQRPDRNAMEADIARGPVPGYAGVMAQGPCGFVILLTDTLRQKAAAERHFRAEFERRGSGCAGPPRVIYRQVQYDFAQLYDWYVGPFRAVWRSRELTSTGIDIRSNQLAVGVGDSAGYERMQRLVDSLPIPRGVTRVDVRGWACSGTGGPSVMVEVRDPAGRPAALGTTIVIQEGAFKDSVDGAHPVSDLHVGAGERRPGRYEVKLYKPGYKPVVLHDVMAPGDPRCRYAEPTDVRKVTLERLSSAPAVRSVTVMPPAMGFGLADYEHQLRAFVDADSGVSSAVHWTSSDTTVATISATGLLRTKCRMTTGETIITAKAVVDERVQGHATVTVYRPADRTCG